MQAKQIIKYDRFYLCIDKWKYKYFCRPTDKSYC